MPGPPRGDAASGAALRGSPSAHGRVGKPRPEEADGWPTAELLQGLPRVGVRREGPVIAGLADGIPGDGSCRGSLMLVLRAVDAFTRSARE